MRVLVIGSGGVGSAFVSIAARRDAFSHIAVADIDPEEQSLIAHAITGLAEGASRRLIENNLEFDPDEVATAMSALAWAGLRALNPTT
ncbi:MAG: hypothetical protein EBS20_11030 [Actinobacteria bacterium]|nr:hypothetical protein [Actinomycetota bacterium]